MIKITSYTRWQKRVGEEVWGEDAWSEKWNKRMKCGYTPSVWLVFPASYFHLLPPSASFWCGKTVLPLLSRDFPLACCCSSRHSHPGRFSTLRGNVWWDCVMIMNPIWIPPDEHTETQWKWRKMCCRANKAQFQIHRQRFNKVSIVTCFLPRPESFAFSHLSSPPFSSSAHSRHQMKMRNSYPITSSGLCVCRFPLVHRQYRQK